MRLALRQRALQVEFGMPFAAAAIRRRRPSGLSAPPAFGPTSHSERIPAFPASSASLSHFFTQIQGAAIRPRNSRVATPGSSAKRRSPAPALIPSQAAAARQAAGQAMLAGLRPAATTARRALLSWQQRRRAAARPCRLPAMSKRGESAEEKRARKEAVKEQKAARRARREGAAPEAGRKACDLCSGLKDTLVRCQVDEGGRWHLVCGRCWRDVSGGVPDGDAAHPHYRYGGLWRNLHALK